MGLNCYYEAVKTDGWTEEEMERVSRFCFPMMAIDMNVVDEDNIPEILIRLKILEKMGTSIFSEKIVDKDLYDLLKSYIGLRTNVSPRTRHQFLTRHAQGLARDADWEIGKFLEKK